MKGHVGGGSGYREPLGSGVSVKAKPFQGSHHGFGCGGCRHVSIYISTVNVIVQERLPEMLASDFGFSPGIGCWT